MVSRMLCFWPGLCQSFAAAAAGMEEARLGLGKNLDVLPKILRMETRAASSYDEQSRPAVRLPKPRQTQFVIAMCSRESMRCSMMRETAAQHDDSCQ